MDQKNITPNPRKPVDRVPTGQLPSALAELTEAALSGAQVQPNSSMGGAICMSCPHIQCSYDGDDE